MQFTSLPGRIDAEAFFNPRARATPAVVVRLRFPVHSEPDEELASVDLDGIEITAREWAGLVGETVSFDADADDGLAEGSIYHHGFHNPIDVDRLHFGGLDGGVLTVAIAGVVDFTYEGLSDLGTPRFDWRVSLTCDAPSLATAWVKYEEHLGDSASH